MAANPVFDFQSITDSPTEMPTGCRFSGYGPLELMPFTAVSTAINWLHLTDLHLALDEPSWLWPRPKHDLFRDLEEMSEKTGPIDLVFFTGDFVRAGKKE